MHHNLFTKLSWYFWQWMIYMKSENSPCNNSFSRYKWVKYSADENCYIMFEEIESGITFKESGKVILNPIYFIYV